MKLTIKEVSVNCEEAVRLRAELSKELKAITGNGGEASFHTEAMEEAICFEKEVGYVRTV